MRYRSKARSGQQKARETIAWLLFLLSGERTEEEKKQLVELAERPWGGITRETLRAEWYDSWVEALQEITSGWPEAEGLAGVSTATGINPWPPQRRRAAWRLRKGEDARTRCNVPAGNPTMEHYWVLRAYDEMRASGYQRCCEELHAIGWQAHDGPILESFYPCGTKARFALAPRVAKWLEEVSRRQQSQALPAETASVPLPGTCQCQCVARYRLICQDGRLFPLRFGREYPLNRS